MPRRRAFLVGGPLILVGLLVGGEWAVRSRAEDGTSPLLYYPHARLPHAFVRGADVGDRIHINRHGLRGPEFELPKSPGVTRVLVVGASTSFDPCAPTDAATWPAQLERRLNAGMSERRFQVLNAGVPGYEMIDHNVRLLLELHELSPDVVLMYAGHGVVNRTQLASQGEVTAAREDRPFEAPQASRVARWLSAHSLLFHLVTSRVRRMVAGPAGDPSQEEWGVAVENAEATFRTQLSAFGRIARGIGAEVVFVELAHVDGSGPSGALTVADRAMWEGAFHVPAEVVLAGYSRFHGVWREVASDVGAAFVSADELALGSPGNFCLPDPIHFSAAGSEAMGARLAARLAALPAFAASDSETRR